MSNPSSRQGNENPPRIWHSLVFRLVAMMLFTTALGTAIVATIIHQTTRSNFDAERVNWQALQEQSPSAIQSEVQSRYTETGMRAACEFVSGLNTTKSDIGPVLLDIVLLDNEQMVHCATRPYFHFAQVVFHDSGTIRLFSESAEVMAFDLEVSESLPLKNSQAEIEGWAMTVEARPLLLEGDEFAWQVWQQSGIWLAITLTIFAVMVAISVRTAIKPIHRIIDAANQLKSGQIPAPLSKSANVSELSALIETFNEATKTLSDSQKLREELVSDIAHELRTPVTNIKGQLEALQLRLVSNNDEFHNTVADEVLLLQQLIADFQELARSDAGQLTLNINSYPLLDLIESCLLPQNQNGKVHFSLFVDESLYVHVDELRFRQVMLNLTENAKHAQPDNLHIEVAATKVNPQAHSTKNSHVTYTPHGKDTSHVTKAAHKLDSSTNYITLTFIDNGPGIAKKDIPHIFERFYRADKSRNRATGGSGLGLAIVSGMVTAMQGSIHYEHRDNCGACFVIILPLGDAPPEEES